MIEKKTVKMFESIPNFETYSHYNSTLEKVFKSNSLKNLIETLKRQKAINEISIMDEISKVNSNEPTDIYANEEIDIKKIHNQEDNDIFDEISEESEQPKNKKEKIKPDLWSITGVESKKKMIQPTLDPFKYNPNYNSIYKNIPSFRIIDPKKSLDNIYSKSKSRNKNKLKEKDSRKNKTKDNVLITEANLIMKGNNYNKTPLKLRNQNTNLNTLSNNNSNIQGNNSNKKEKKASSLSKNKLFESINTNNNGNHALRFSKYIPRKFNIPENNKIISYLEPVNYIKPKNKNKSIDFDKMLHRNEKNLIYASQLRNPSFVNYNPKYTCIDKDKNVRLFNPEEKDPKINKKYLMKKLWASYKVNTDYQLIDNNKI